MSSVLKVNLEELDKASCLQFEHQDSASSLLLTDVVTLNKRADVSGSKLSSVKCVQWYMQPVTACHRILVRQLSLPIVHNRGNWCSIGQMNYQGYKPGKSEPKYKPRHCFGSFTSLVHTYMLVLIQFTEVTGEVKQWLRAGTALEGGLSSALSTQVRWLTTTSCNIISMGYNNSSLPTLTCTHTHRDISMYTHAHVHIHMNRYTISKCKPLKS